MKTPKSSNIVNETVIYSKEGAWKFIDNMNYLLNNTFMVSNLTTCSVNHYLYHHHYHYVNVIY